MAKSVDAGTSKLALILKLAREKKFMEMRMVAAEPIKSRNTRFS